jgi:hypothetical protein
MNNQLESKTKTQADFQRKVLAVALQPWAGWVRKLLTHLCGWYFPTIDGEKAVRVFELLCRELVPVGIQSGPEAAFQRFSLDKFGMTLNEVARFWGHTCAIFDYMRFEGFPKAAQHDAYFKNFLPDGLNPGHFLDAEADAQSAQAAEFLRAETALKMLELDFAARTEFLSEFGFAYGKTFTPDGRLVGKTDASEIYLRLLMFLPSWFIMGRPRNIADLNRRMYPLSSGKDLTPLQKLQLRDAQKQMEIRLRQLCHRLGLHLRASKSKPLNKPHLHK